MNERGWYIFFGLATAIVVAMMVFPTETHNVGFAILDIFTKGARLTVTKLDSTGKVPASPYELAAMATEQIGQPIDVEEYSLARMGRSEGSNGREVRMHVLINDLEAHPNLWSSITELVTYSNQSTHNGYYGEQGHGRRYASSQDPYEGDVAMARKVMGDRATGVDLAQGATKFVDKAAFGKQKGTGSYEAVVASWAKEGLKPFNTPLATDDFVLFRKA